MPGQEHQRKELIEAIEISIDKPGKKIRFGKSQVTKIIFGIFILLLVLLLWFVISAKTVIVEIAPAPDEVDLINGSFVVKISDRFLARAGEYQLTASKRGYYPFNEKVSIGMLPSYIFKRTLKKKPGFISINLDTPDRARVYINQRYIGVAPIEEITLAAGTHSIELQRYRYQTLRSELQVEGAEVKQQFLYSMKPNWSAVSLDSKPSNAQVWLDGIRYDNTPLSIQLDAGTYRMEIVHPDYSAHISDFVVLPNQPLDLGTINLARDPSHLVIKSRPAGASVYLNDKKHGITPLTINATPDTDYQLRFTKSGYRALSRTVKIAPGESKTVSVALKPILATLHLDVSPKTAEVYIDGVSKGVGNKTLSLTTAEHIIEVKESGYQPYSITIKPQANEPIHKTVSLKLREIQPARQADLITNSEGQRLRLITPGEFVMGASRREQGRRANEVLRNVKLTRRFYIGVSEVTNEEYARFDPEHNSGTFGGVSLSGAELPVTSISWEQAARYCNWLSRKEDLPITYHEKNGKMVTDEHILHGYRLVTEAEWAWVARMSSDGALLRYSWGNQYPPASLNGNYADESTKQIIGLVIAGVEDGFAGPAPVRSFPSNHYGVFDIDGNVSEWVHDYYTIHSAPGTQVFVDPAGPPQGKHHVIRGASWLRGTLSNTRLAYRDYRQKPKVDVGFRIARYVDIE